MLDCAHLLFSLPQSVYIRNILTLSVVFVFFRHGWLLKSNRTNYFGTDENLPNQFNWCLMFRSRLLQLNSSISPKSWFTFKCCCLASYKMWKISLQWIASSLNANSNVISLISHHNGFSWVSNVDLLLPSLPLLSYHMRAAVNQFLLYCWFPQWFCAVGYRVSTKQRVEYQLTNRRLLDHRVIGPACSTHQHTRRCWAGWRPLHVDE